MTKHSSHDGYVVKHSTQNYEIGALNGELIGACLCGAGQVWPDKGLGRAAMAAWRTQHQHIGGLE